MNGGLDDYAALAASDQAHAEAEQTLDKLIGWWAENRADLCRSDDVAALTHILGSGKRDGQDYAALLATAIIRLIPVPVEE